MNKEIKIKQASEYEMGGTSFYGETISTTLGTLHKAFGNIDYAFDDGKTDHNFDLVVEFGNNKYFCTIYDWKEYRKIDENETIEWHIGAKDKEESVKCRLAILHYIENNI